MVRCCSGVGQRPKIPFDSIAGGTTVDKVVQFVTATAGAGLEVVNLQFAANLLLAHPKVAAAEIVGATHCLTLLLVIHIASRQARCDQLFPGNPLIVFLQCLVLSKQLLHLCSCPYQEFLLLLRQSC